jgi:DinB superfamily
MAEGGEQRPMRVDDAIPLLEATPAILRSLLAHLPKEGLDFQEDAGAWSPRTVLVHFIQNERTNWMPRVQVTLSPGEVRKFAPFQQLPPPGEIDDTDVDAGLAEFASLRQGSLQVLRGLNLKPEDYRRTAEHPSLGTVTLAQLLATWVVHDLNHTHQILKTLAKRHASAVGPWRQYLGILEL